MEEQQYSFIESYYQRQTTLQSQREFKERGARSIQLTMVLAKSSADTYADRQLLLTECTPEDTAYHFLWYCQKPSEEDQQVIECIGQATPLRFHEYYEFCRDTLRSISEATQDLTEFKLCLFCERYLDDLKANDNVLAKLSGSRQCPFESSTTRDMYFHLATPDGITVYTLPFDFPVEEIKPDEIVPFRFLDGKKPFLMRKAKRITYYAAPEGWEGLDGKLDV